MVNKFRGSYQDLQDRVLLVGAYGMWNDKGNHKQFRTEDGAVLSWWESTKTILFQGPKDLAEDLKLKFDNS